MTGESVVSRAVRVVDAFRPGETTLGVSEIARRAGLHVATASRLVAELVELGLLRRDTDRRVGLGLRLWELGARASPALSLREVAMPLMEDLHAVVGQHTQLGVLDGAEVLFLERLSAPGAVVNHTRIAGRLPLHASSSGLVLLAHASAELQERTLAGPLRAFTRETITTAARLRATLDQVRREGVVSCPGHIHRDACGIAVPVRSPSGAVVAALAVVVPNDAEARTQVPALRAAARGIGRQLPSR
ncbi:IclR family transcriptional regulator [Modestobacter sp. Leaf380]|uniref:IclR family transcriptional regulator n=1 Tax=Modestobacter sp. Leaf380 TaxID=1736356 RepID=UPI0006FE8672|nr:IclR family transcriptional regulator [Modestobacter sp. Leaf380]KQS68648.1 IclR family transcriptional regulator [Modestobacter sp. Leaf380]